MYTRVPSGRMPRGMRVPENYAGTAFRPSPHEPPQEHQTPAPPPPRDDSPPAEQIPKEKAPQEPMASDAPTEASPEPPTESVHAKPASLGHKLPFRLPSFGAGLNDSERYVSIFLFASPLLWCISIMRLKMFLSSGRVT